MSLVLQETYTTRGGPWVKLVRLVRVVRLVKGCQKLVLVMQGIAEALESTFWVGTGGGGSLKRDGRVIMGNSEYVFGF